MTTVRQTRALLTLLASMSWMAADAGSATPAPSPQTQLELFYREGMKRLTNADRSDDEEGIRFLSAAAAGGLAVAQYDLAVSYERGNGVEQDSRKEVEWLRRAAGQGHSDAQYKLATCYRTGKGVGIDPEKAFYWYLKGAEQDDVEAQNNVAAAYVHGDGTKKSAPDAAIWYERAAANGYARARVSLVYLWLDRTSPDYVNAGKWMILASAVRESLPPGMQQQLASLQDRIESHLTVDDKQRANELASDWTLNRSNASRPRASRSTP